MGLLNILEEPVVSVIMPVFNAEEYLPFSIKSVINQTFKNWELIVVDDGSTDNSSKIIAKFAQEDKRIVYIYQHNRKQAAARNHALDKAKGNFIAFLDADDYWFPEKLTRQLNLLNSSDADICYSGGDIIDAKGKFLTKYPTFFGKFSGLEMYKRMYKYNPIPIMAVVMKKSLVYKVGLQDETEEIHGCEDLDYWLRIAYTNARFLGIDEKLFLYRINPKGTSRGVLKMKMAECTALYKNLDYKQFDHYTRKGMQVHFLDLIRDIIPELAALRRYNEIPFYFRLLYQITGFSRYCIAALLYKFLPFKTNKGLGYFLNPGI
ncbi:glycosyltransferase family 2 protein [Mucilaginibacter ginkgonis]|uniref:Glycosyltransferase family 2 protein n=1 Tax=Mucilaginibacter ginkgonis TaxID=2682091 RepID=A0A7T7JH38_9SPHI|nr:glycosyltransferase family 2 protein [Mucilaginibacter ginkgonis]QQL50198.1 glycosyltransferase family 2 protein [Mucilaginibacter ginkgonis]